MNEYDINDSHEHLDDLADHAISAAAAGLSAYMKDRGLTPSKSDWEPLTDLVRAKVKEAVPEALEDTRRALMARMPHHATAIFRSSMAVAGANAGKIYFGEIAK